MEEKKVLVVDDDLDFLKIVTFRLKREGYNVLTAISGEEAVRIVKEGKIGIVFLDIKMPGIDGIETLKRIREFDKDITVLMLTAYYKKDHPLHKSMEFNISGFIPKGGEGEVTSLVMETFLRTLKKQGK